MKLLNNKLGMTLIEIIVAVGLLGGVSLATMQLMTTSQKSNREFEKSVDVLSLEKTIAAYILSENGCRHLSSTTIGSSFKIKKYKSKHTITTIFDKRKPCFIRNKTSLSQVFR